MGCLRRLGCVLLVALVAAGAWVMRDRWLPLVWHRAPVHAAADTPAGAAWELVTPELAERGKAAIQRLSPRAGPVFANLSAAEFTAYVIDQLSRQLPPSAQGTTAAIIGDQLFIRAMVRPADLGVDKALGPLKAVLGEREPMEFGGTLDIARPGLGEFRVRSLKIRDFAIPDPAIPSILARFASGVRPARIADDAMPLVIPVHIADVRVHNGKITLYRSGQ